VRDPARSSRSRQWALRLRAERLIAAYIEPNSDRPAIINELTLFDGPQQREAQRLSEEARSESNA
jgi:hypothetical protein